MTGPGRVILAATPLGNPADASPRLAAALASADVIAAEDTRKLRRLARDLGATLRGRVLSLHDSIEGRRATQLLADLTAGSDVLVVTDAGMPAVSDPGFRIARAAIDAGIPVTVLPGPSAVLAALVVSGLPVDRFCFEGFLPRRGAERRRRLDDLATEPRTMVFFESPHRLQAALTDMVAAFGEERPAALCRELTKTYEEVRRGTLSDLAAGAEGARGEITLVVGGFAGTGDPGTPAEWARRVSARVAEGEDRRSAITGVAGEYAVPRRSVYDAVVASKHADSEGPGERK